MELQVKLKDIINELEVQIEDSLVFLNIKTGQIAGITLEELRAAEDEEPYEHLSEWQQADRLVAIEIIEQPEEYLELPNKYDINEYEIMENFCLDVSNQKVKDILLKAIHGKGAFRRFKDTVIDYGIEDQWYSYREESLKQIAIEWCRENNVNYVE